MKEKKDEFARRPLKTRESNVNDTSRELILAPVMRGGKVQKTWRKKNLQTKVYITDLGNKLALIRTERQYVCM